MSVSIQAANIKAPIDPRITNKITTLVSYGIRSVSEMQHHLDLFVREIFRDTDRPLPSRMNRRFFPSRSDISRLMYRERVRQMSGLVDEDLLQKHIDEWKLSSPEDNWFFRRYSDPTMSADDMISEEDDVSMTSPPGGLLFIHQTGWQKRLLQKYGNELSFIDATYKTTCYALPLFFVCVRTNVGYCVVASFVVQSEDSKSLIEALNILKEWNPAWQPKAFMADGSEVEHIAIQSVFPG